jgi:hypothetical protein
MNAVYAARGSHREIDATLPLALNEPVITEGMVRRYTTNAFVQRPCYLRLTPVRLALLEHFMTRPDRVTEVPPGAVEEVAQEGSLVMIAWRGPGGTRTVKLQPKSPLFPVVGKLPDTADELTEKLKAWRRSADGGGT